MRKYIAIALSIITCSIFTLAAHKTALVLRDHRHRAEAFTTFHTLQPNPKKSTSRFKTKLQSMSFYNETLNEGSLGRLFGTGCSNRIKVGTPAQVTALTADVENSFLLHYGETPANNTLQGTICFEPKHTAQGKTIEAYIGLDKILKGLYFKKNFSFMIVKNDLNATFFNEISGTNANEAHKLMDILSGKTLKRGIHATATNVQNTQSEQEALKYAKIRCGETRTGLNNIESVIGYKFLDTDDYYVGIHLSMQTPSGDRPTAEFLWEPRLGSQHLGFGAGFEAGATLFKNFRLSCEFNYRYELEEGEKRTLGIKNILTTPKYANHFLSHYYLLGKVGKYTLYPAANILTKEVDVLPGSQIDTFVLMTYKLKKLSFDLGYNLFWKEREAVKLPRCSWEDNTYAIAAFDWKTCTATSAFSGATAQPANTFINYANIDTTIAESPSILSHKIFWSIGYIFEHWSSPLMIALGGAAEYGNGYESAESITGWLKLGFAF